MPTYTYKCDKCEVYTDRVKLVRNRDNTEKCETCKTKMKRVLTNPQRIWTPTRNL